MDRVDEVLASLREERERLVGELARVEQAIASLEGSTPAARLYAMHNAYEAAAHYLASVGEPRTTRQIADALVAGGFKTRSSNFTTILGTMLRRTESARQAGIHRTADQKRWFVRR